MTRILFERATITSDRFVAVVQVLIEHLSGSVQERAQSITLDRQLDLVVEGF
jgi:hypothetical protein